MDNGSDTMIETYTLHGGTSPHAGMNRLASIAYDMNADGDTLDNGDYTTSFAYDQNGNMTDKDVDYVDPATPDEAWDFAYNEDDLLEAVVKDASTVAEYRYDPLGRRAFKKVGADKEAYFYDGEDVLLETDGTDILRDFVHGPGIDDYVAMHIPAGQANAGTYFYHADGLGSVTDMTLQSDSSVQTRYEYQPFGQATVLSGPTLAGINPYEYTGRRYDVESGLMYYRSRMYDPAQKRFPQADKYEGYLLKPETVANKYIYVDDNPVNKIDCFGYCGFAALGSEGHAIFSMITSFPAMLVGFGGLLTIPGGPGPVAPYILGLVGLANDGASGIADAINLGVAITCQNKATMEIAGGISYVSNVFISPSIFAGGLYALGLGTASIGTVGAFPIIGAALVGLGAGWAIGTALRGCGSDLWYIIKDLGGRLGHGRKPDIRTGRRML